MSLSIIELWAVMGALAKGVVVLLVVMSLLSLATAVEKWLVLRWAARESERFLAAWRIGVSQGGVLGTAPDPAQYPHSHVAHVIAAGTSILEADLAPGIEREAYDRTVRRTVLAAAAGMRRGLSIIATVGSTAPFVGLFGTVVGIVNAFQELSRSGQGSVGQVSAGIAEALVTTAFGIGVAIPAVWLFNHLSQWIARAVVDMECAAEELAVVALRQRDKTASAPALPVGR